MASPKRKPIPGTGDFIKNHLQAVGEDYCYKVYKLFCEVLQKEGQRCPVYPSFRKYWWILTKLGLIEVVRRETGERRMLISIYQLVPENVDSAAWQNPQAARDIEKGRFWVDPVTRDRVPVSRLGKRRYARRVLGRPPGSPGRPKKKIQTE